MRLVFIACLQLVLALGKSQNLVPNPSFEEYDTCPDNLIQLIRATHWFYVSEGTSDYFNSCDLTPYNMSVPANTVGYQMANSGNAYAGSAFTTIDSLLNGTNFDRVEYLGVRLIEPLNNTLYKVSFYVSLSDSVNGVGSGPKLAGSGINIFNCHFSNTPVYEDTLGMLAAEPNFEVKTDNPVTDSLGWTKLQGYYYAQGGEEYMIIGQLNKNYYAYNTNRYFYFAGIKSIVTYYYYDDVEVVPVSESAFPNIFTPNGDGINDAFDLKISCYNCGLQLQIYNRWGQLLFTTDQFKWDGTYNGNLCADGVYYYVLNDTVNKKNVHSGFFQLQKQ